ncbi:MAG: SDR family NAD(P)-dependent oxidoreductase [Gammaproteobacteria bacterium]|nr:SDR family NAD(P)-dependent oxidoreductase [Gammaproteobacteria bacterium]
MRRFDGVNVTVTGAAGVLGMAVAQAFIDEGAKVRGIDVVESETPFSLYQADLTNPQDALRVVAEIGQIDVLANIAGGFTMGDTVETTSDETWDFMYNLNARTVFNMVRAVVPQMVEREQGKIVNIGALNALSGVGRMAAYSASKSVVIRLTESLAEELKTKHVNVNCILPSIIDTPRNREDMPKADFSAWVSPSAMAKVVLFLASTDADPIHGAALPVKGLA